MSRRAAQAAGIAGAVVAEIAFPAVASAHSLDSTYQSRLPLIVYLAGAGLAVALSFAFVLLRDLRAEPPPMDAPASPAAGCAAGRPPADRRRRAGPGSSPRGSPAAASAADVGTLFVWVYTLGRRRGRLGVPVPDLALAGPVLDDPRPAGGWVLRRLGSGAGRSRTIPRGWAAGRRSGGFDLRDLAGARPARRAGPRRCSWCSSGYTAFTLAMMAQFGRDTWRANGEVFTVWFRLLNRLAPFGLADEEGRRATAAVRQRPARAGLAARRRRAGRARRRRRSCSTD